MSSHTTGRHESDWYEIRLEGRLDDRWASWFDQMTIATEAGPDRDPLTVLRGHVVDQAALHGLLARLRDLDLPLVSLARVEPAAEEEP